MKELKATFALYSIEFYKAHLSKNTQKAQETSARWLLLL